MTRASVAMLMLSALAWSCDDPRPQPAPTEATSAPAPATSATAAPATSASAAANDDAQGWLVELLQREDPRMRGWLGQAEPLRIQILLSVVKRARPDDPAPQLVRHAFRVDAEYVYPASAIKTFVALAALKRLEQLSEEHQAPFDARTLLRRCQHPAGKCEVYPEDEDEEKEDGTFRVGPEIQKLLGYSDNHSYERLFDLTGHREVNEIIASFGFSSVRIHHRMGAPAERSRGTARVLAYPRGKVVSLPAKTSTLELAPTPAGGLAIGRAHMDGGRLVEEPLDFGKKNYASLEELQRLQVALLLPESEPGRRLGISEEQRALLVRAMTGKLKPLSWVEQHKPLLGGVLEVLDEKRIRYVNKAGRAYGFLLDNAYIEDMPSGRAFFVTAVIYANPNGVLNDDDYDYDDTAKPFMKALGQILARSILQRGEGIVRRPAKG